MADKNDKTGRNVLLAASGAGLLWLLLRRGGGFGLGSGRGDGEGASTTGLVNIRVDALGISIEGRPADLAGAVEAAKQAGRADLVITGAARTGTVNDLLAGLDAAGVKYAAKGVGHA